jgi:4,5-dihydroxyphthalate decarboxylase
MPARVLTTVVGDYPHTAGLKDGRVGSDLLTLEHIRYEPVHDAFAEMAGEQKFDVCEMAIATYLQATDHGQPLTLLPIVLVGRFQHRYLAHRANGAVRRPTELGGHRVGVRSYTVTTGLWVRGFLAEQYGVDLDSITWVGYEPPHVREYRNPPNVEAAPEGADILGMLRDGSTDAAVLGSANSAAGEIRPLIEDPDAAARDWYAEHQIVPVNHLVTIRSQLVREDPAIAGELIRMFSAAKALAGPGGTALERALGADPTPIGAVDVGPRVALAAELAHTQHLIARRPALAEIFGG